LLHFAKVEVRASQENGEQQPSAVPQVRQGVLPALARRTAAVHRWDAAPHSARFLKSFSWVVSPMLTYKAGILSADILPVAPQKILIRKCSLAKVYTEGVNWMVYPLERLFDFQISSFVSILKKCECTGCLDVFHPIE